MRDHSPTVRHRRLAAELRKLREHGGLSAEDAAAALGWSRTKLTRFETARTRPTSANVAEMLDLYGGDEAIKLALMRLARDIRKRGWWAAYGDVLAGSFAELEDDAAKMRTWHTEVVPGLLQTEGYAHALISGYTVDEVEVDRRVQARMHRQTLLSRKNAPLLQVLIDEAVLRRPVGGTEIMREQLRALLTTAERPNVSVRVVPLSAGAHPALGDGSFVIFSFTRSEDQDVVYEESVAGGVYIEDIAQVRRCSVTYGRIADVALSEEESAALIAAIAKE